MAAHDNFQPYLLSTSMRLASLFMLRNTRLSSLKPSSGTALHSKYEKNINGYLLLKAVPLYDVPVDQRAPKLGDQVAVFVLGHVQDEQAKVPELVGEADLVEQVSDGQQLQAGAPHGLLHEV